MNRPEGVASGELITLERGRPEFMAYLRGSFSKDHRALPLRTLNLKTDAEIVTFRIVPVENLSRPPWIVVWLKALRPRSFLTVLVPLLTVLSITPMAVDPDLPWLAALGVVFLYAALLLRNDVQDHVSGFDRVRGDRGSRAIQNGWLTVGQLETASWAFLFLATVCALPVIWVRPLAGIVVLVAAVLGATAFFRRNESFRDLTTGHLMYFLLGGPLLFMGLDAAMNNVIGVYALCAGLLWGWAILFPVHLRDFENLIADAQSGRASLVGRAGFDKGVRLLHAWWFVTLAGFAGFHLWFGERPVVWVLFLILVATSMGFSSRLRALRSPAGSEVARIRRRGEFLFVGFVALWILESAWRLLE